MEIHRLIVDRRQNAYDVTAKYYGLNLIDVTICDDLGQSLFHVAIMHQRNKIFNKLIKLDNDATKYHDRLGNVMSPNCFLYHFFFVFFLQFS